jgi:ribulose-phosphate 3-epimerase
MKNKSLKISASLWSANLAELSTSMRLVEDYCGSFHFDIMDGHFVNNLLFGPDLIKALRKYSNKAFEIHLMVNNPEEIIEHFIEAGGDIFILHTQTCKQPFKVILELKGKGKKVGIVLKVDDDYEEIMQYLHLVDYIIVMGTAIGVKGAALSLNTYERIKYLRNIIDHEHYGIELQVDGGIRKETVPELFKSGADIITAGSLLFDNNYEDIYLWIRGLDAANR